MNFVVLTRNGNPLGHQSVPFLPKISPTHNFSCSFDAVPLFPCIEQLRDWSFMKDTMIVSFGGSILAIPRENCSKRNDGRSLQASKASGWSFDYFFSNLDFRK